MFGYVRKDKVSELVRLYEKLLVLSPLRTKYPQAWLAVNAQIGDLKDELGLHTNSRST